MFSQVLKLSYNAAYQDRPIPQSRGPGKRLFINFFTDVHTNQVIPISTSSHLVRLSITCNFQKNDFNYSNFLTFFENFGSCKVFEVLQFVYDG